MCRPTVIEAGDPEFYDLLDGYDEGYPGGEEGYIYYKLTQLFPPSELLELDTTREERKFFYDELDRLVQKTFDDGKSCTRFVVR